MSRLHKPFGHPHPHQPPGPCCWVGGGTGPICPAHERAVGEAVNRDAAAAGRSAVDLFGPLPGTSEIEVDGPGSATPAPIEDREEQP